MGGCLGGGGGGGAGAQKNLEPGGTWQEASGHSGRTLWRVWAGLEAEAMGNLEKALVLAAWV